MHNELPNVSATETADLIDVHMRLAKTRLFSYWQTFHKKHILRTFPWVHSFWPRWF